MKSKDTDQPINNHEMAEAVRQQAFDLWINPEIEHRKQAGKLPDNFSVSMAQILFSVGAPPVVRLNEEVKTIGRLKLSRSVKKGDLIRYKDVKEIHGFELIPEERDFGHITLVRFPDQWIVFFSFIYDTSKSKQFLEIATRFMKSAHSALEQDNYRPMINDLAVAAENCAKARLILLPNEKIRKARTHKTIKNEVNIFASKSDVIPQGFKTAFNRIIELRDDARYRTDFDLEESEAKKLYGDVLSLVKEVRRMLATYRQ